MKAGLAENKALTTAMIAGALRRVTSRVTRWAENRFRGRRRRSRKVAVRRRGNGRWIVLGRPRGTPSATCPPPRRLPATPAGSATGAGWYPGIHRAGCAGSVRRVVPAHRRRPHVGEHAGTLPTGVDEIDLPTAGLGIGKMCKEGRMNAQCVTIEGEIACLLQAEAARDQSFAERRVEGEEATRASAPKRPSSALRACARADCLFGQHHPAERSENIGRKRPIRAADASIATGSWSDSLVALCKPAIGLECALSEKAEIADKNRYPNRA